MIELQYEETTTLGPSGFHFYTRHLVTGAFDADDYADACKINRTDIDEQSIKAVQNAAAQLAPGAFLSVWHGYNKGETACKNYLPSL